MRKKTNPANTHESYHPLYLQLRRPAMALALAATQNAPQAYQYASKAHQWAGTRHARKQIDSTIVLHHLYRKLPKHINNPDSALMLPDNFSTLDLRARAVWVLHRVVGFDCPSIAAALKLTQDDVQGALSAADEKLNSHEVQRYGQQLDLLLEKKEIWNDIHYVLERQTRTGHLLRKSSIIIILAALLLLIGREALLMQRILRLHPQASSQEITESYDDANFYKHFPEAPSAEYPGINQLLVNRMDMMNDDQRLRVAFRYYDRNVMLNIHDNGRNLEDLYVDMYHESYNRGVVNNFIANAIMRYYDNYERPYLPELRKAAFRSDYDSIYHAAMTLAQDDAYRRLVDKNPEVFGTQQQFEAYLFSQNFLKEVPGLLNLLLNEYKINQRQSDEDAEDAQLRQAYEESLFAFTNPAGLNGRVSTSNFAFRKEQLEAFFASREALGKRLYKENVAQALQCMPQDAKFNSDILEGNESSLMSATLTKSEILRLSQDHRFFFLGVAPVNAAYYGGRIESELGAKVRDKLFERHEVFVMDDVYRLYSVNYAAPLTLPRGFIDDLRNRINCRDTQFEMELQYIYQMRYAHPEARLGWTVLRTLDSNSNVQFTSNKFKHFTRMARN